MTGSLSHAGQTVGRAAGAEATFTGIKRCSVRTLERAGGPWALGGEPWGARYNNRCHCCPGWR